MIVVLGTFDMAPQDRDTFVGSRREQVERTRQESGCLEYSFTLDALDTGRVRLIERWADQQSLDDHLAAVRQAGGPPAVVEVTGRHIMMVTGEVTSEVR